MVIQMITLHISAIQLACDLYKAIVVIRTYSLYLMAIEILLDLFWSIINIIKMVAFNYVCERICTQVCFCIKE